MDERFHPHIDTLEKLANHLAEKKDHIGCELLLTSLSQLNVFLNGLKTDAQELKQLVRACKKEVNDVISSPKL